MNDKIIYIRVFDTPSFENKFINYEKNKVKYILIKENSEFYKIYAYANGFFTAYVPKIDGVNKLSLIEELQLKLFLSIPIFFLLLIIFIEDISRSNFKLKTIWDLNSRKNGCIPTLSRNKT